MISIFSKKYDYPVFIENEANLSALAEYTYSSDKNRLININIKSGIGAGIAQLGELQKGSNGRFGEIGQTILFPNGAKFPCGNNGCLELYASTEVLYNNIRSKINLIEISIDDLVNYWNQNDRITSNELLTNIEYLSIGINNLITSFDPDEIIINSPLFNKIPSLLDYLNQFLHSTLTKDTILSVSKF